jgi:hypothetical protein
MATLQTFQAEIEDIRNRELAKSRSQAQPEALRRGYTDHKFAPKVRKKAVAGDPPATSPITPKFANDQSAEELNDIENAIEARHKSFSSHLSFSLRYHWYRVLSYPQWKKVVRREI